MQDADCFPLQVFLCSEEIDQGAESIGIEPYGQSIDREISSIQVEFYGTRFYGGKRPG